jgi:uncharacterized protein (TIGR04255 family)
VPFSLEQDPPRERYRQNPLKSVVWQVRFPPLLLVNDPSFVAHFQAAIRTDYPLAEPRASQVSVAVGQQGASATSEPAAWHFRDESGSWLVALHQQWLSLETEDYVQFEDFRDRLEALLVAAEPTLGLTHIERMGLRYVDQIQAAGASTPAQFARYLNDNLIGVVAGEQLSPYVIDAIQMIRLDVDQHQMTIRHGFVGTRTGHEDAPFYLIDTDAYEIGPRAYDRGYCLERTYDFKRYCWKVFRQSIRDELVELLQPMSIEHA